jgi:aspartate racemase
MRTIGLIGGMSWLSTIEYYRILNETIAHKYGGAHSARIILYSVNFQDIITLQEQGAWEEAGRLLASAAQSLEAAGADILLICAVTMHKVAQAVQDAITIPLLHIADVTADAILAREITKVGLLGTRYTMEDPFFIHRMQTLGIETLVPQQSERELVHHIIFEELSRGNISELSRKKIFNIMTNLGMRGVQGIILGCTEITLLIKQEDTPMLLFDTTVLHAIGAIEKTLEKEF